MVKKMNKIYILVENEQVMASVYNPASEVADGLLSNGYIEVDSIPAAQNVANKASVLKYNDTEKFFYEYIDRPLTMEEELAVLKNAQKSSDQKYKEINGDTASLADLKAAKIAQLKEKCDQAIEDGFLSPSIGHVFGFKSYDQSNIHAQLLVFLMDPNETECDWKTEDAGVVTLTKDEFMNLVPEGKNHVRTNTAKYWNLVAQVNGTTTNAEVDAINW